VKRESGSDFILRRDLADTAGRAITAVVNFIAVYVCHLAATLDNK
jgi:hypothetical protein